MKGAAQNRINACLNGGCEDLLLPIIQQTPIVALPGVVAAVNGGYISLEDYDITNEAKEQIQGIADSVANNISDDSSSLTHLA